MLIPFVDFYVQEIEIEPSDFAKGSFHSLFVLHFQNHFSKIWTSKEVPLFGIRFPDPSCRFFLAGPGPQDVLQRPPMTDNPFHLVISSRWSQGITPLRGQILRVAAIYRSSFYLQELYDIYVVFIKGSVCLWCRNLLYKVYIIYTVIILSYIHQHTYVYACICTDLAWTSAASRKMRTVLIWVSLRFPRFPPLATIGKHQWYTQILACQTVWPVAPAACYEVKVELRWRWWLN